jgi:hypothetical protein
LSPDARPSLSRISRGTVTWPLLVKVVSDIRLSLRYPAS